MTTQDDVLGYVEMGVDALRRGRSAYHVRTLYLRLALAAANRTNHPEKGRVLRLMNWCRAAERAADRRAA